MTILDAQALVAYFDDAPAAPLVRPLLSTASISSINLAEVIDQLTRVRGVPIEVTRYNVGKLLSRGLEVLDALSEIGQCAGEIRARHYNRRFVAISMADCFAAATALELSAPLATADTVLADVVRREGGSVIVLPRSTAR